MVNNKLLVISKANYILFTDIELISHWNLGDEEAFAVFYKRHVKALVQLAYMKTVDAAVAEEIVQDSFLSLYQHQGTSFINPLGYLKVILKNKVIDFYRKRSVTPLSTQLGELDLKANKRDPEIELITKEQDWLLNDAIEHLPKKCGEVFKLRRMEDLSNKEVASRLGLSVNTVEQHMRKAIRLLSRMGLIAVILTRLFR